MRFLALAWQGDFALNSKRPVSARPARRWGVGWALLGVVFIVPGVLAAAPDTAPLLVMGGGMLALGVWMLRTGIDVTLVGKNIRVRRRGLFRDQTFEDSVAAYRGVVHRTMLYRKSRAIWGPDGLFSPYFENIHVQRIELVHPERGWTVPIFQKVSDEIPRREWEGYARRFELPLLIEDGGRWVERAPEDLDKTLKELARDGALAGPTTAGRPPWTFSIASGPNLIAIAIRRPAVGWLPVGFAAVLPAVMAAKGVATGAPGLLSWGIGLMGAVAYLGAIRHHILIYRDRIEWRRVFPFIANRLLGDIPLDQVEQVSVRKVSGERKASLLLSGDTGSLTIGRGVRRSHLEWLRDYITSAIVTS